MSDYDTDIALWSEHQAALLRRRAAGQMVNDADLDWSNIAEEIESLGKAVAHELSGDIAIVLEDLFKLAASPTDEPRNDWKRSIIGGRLAIRRVLKNAPSLHRAVAGMIADETPTARELAIASLEERDEQPRVVIDGLTFTEDQILGDWFPDDPAS